jgi:hypothetical protein
MYIYMYIYTYMKELVFEQSLRHLVEVSGPCGMHELLGDFPRPLVEARVLGARHHTAHAAQHPDRHTGTEAQKKSMSELVH